ncbi:Uncharacterised protein [Streptococcus pneumoniae]|nr:Uncharacterised protein [Streptococcus pneumoniae]
MRKEIAPELYNYHYLAAAYNSSTLFYHNF